MTDAIPAKRTEAPEVMCIGETMIMMTPTNGVGVAKAQTFTVSHGGAESNVAQYLAELGVRSAWISALGADPFGERVLAAIESSGVDTRWVRRDMTATTGLYVKDPGADVYYYRTGSAASRLSPSDIAEWPISTAKWIHLSGITPALSESCRAMVSTVICAARDAGVGISFDVNYRPALWRQKEAASIIRSLASRVDVVLVGRDEAEQLWGTATAEDVAGLFPTQRYVVVKDGGIEAVEFHRGNDHEHITRVPARAAEMVEAVGAGDAFGAGYIAALIRGDDAARRLELGHSLAAWVLGSAGDYRAGHGLQAHRR